MTNKNEKFEVKINELETIIAELESGNSDLEESIAKYTKAMQLVKECDEKLKDIEIKITQIVSDNNTKQNFELE